MDNTAIFAQILEFFRVKSAPLTQAEKIKFFNAPFPNDMFSCVEFYRAGSPEAFEKEIDEMYGSLPIPIAKCYRVQSGVWESTSTGTDICRGGGSDRCPWKSCVRFLGLVTKSMQKRGVPAEYSHLLHGSYRNGPAIHPKLPGFMNVPSVVNLVLDNQVFRWPAVTHKFDYLIADRHHTLPRLLNDLVVENGAVGFAARRAQFCKPPPRLPLGKTEEETPTKSLAEVVCTITPQLSTTTDWEQNYDGESTPNFGDRYEYVDWGISPADFDKINPNAKFMPRARNMPTPTTNHWLGREQMAPALARSNGR